MALTNQTAFPNLTTSNYGNLNSGFPNISPGNAGVIGEAARSLCFFFDPDAIASLKMKSIHLIYSVNFKIYSGAEGISRLFGRLMVIRNFAGALNPMLFDPLLTDNVPNIKDAGNVGNNWQTPAGVTLPRFDWDAADILHNNWLSLNETRSLDIPLPELQPRKDSLLVVMTPLYGNAAGTPAPNNNADTTLGWAGLGVFLGATGVNNNLATIGYRSLSVIGVC